MSFQFRFQSVLQLRRQERNRIQQSFSGAQTIATRLAAECQQLINERQSFVGEIRKLKDGSPWEVSRMIQLQRHVDHLRHDIQLKESCVVEAQKALAAERDRLIQADQLVEALERLMQKQLAEYQILESRVETREIDEVTTSRHWIMRNAGRTVETDL